jgi:hypothetical protein
LIRQRRKGGQPLVTNEREGQNADAFTGWLKLTSNRSMFNPKGIYETFGLENF